MKWLVFGVGVLFFVGEWVIAQERADRAALEKKLAPYFEPPAKFANDFGKYRSPLRFDDGSLVKSAADWPRRREEIRTAWHKAMGAWPPLVETPKIEYLSKEKRENVTQCKVRIQIAPNRVTDDAYLLIPEGKGPFPAVVVVFYDAASGIGAGRTKMVDWAWRLAKRGYVTLSVGSAPETYYPTKEECKLQPLSWHAYVAANCHNLLASLPMVDARRIGIIGHSYGGKWAMFGGALYDRFACVVVSDPGIVFDETRGNVNYWDPWYLGFDSKNQRKRSLPSVENPSVGPYRDLVKSGRDLHEIHALIAPRPFLVSGGSEDFPARWQALNHLVQINRLLGHDRRIAMTNRPGHGLTEEANGQIEAFFDLFLKH